MYIHLPRDCCFHVPLKYYELKAALAAAFGINICIAYKCRSAVDVDVGYAYACDECLGLWLKWACSYTSMYVCSLKVLAGWVILVFFPSMQGKGRGACMRILFCNYNISHIFFFLFFFLLLAAFAANKVDIMRNLVLSIILWRKGCGTVGQSVKRNLKEIWEICQNLVWYFRQICYIKSLNILKLIKK